MKCQNKKCMFQATEKLAYNKQNIFLCAKCKRILTDKLKSDVAYYRFQEQLKLK